MNYGLYLAASGVSTNMARLDVLSNNLSNVNTVGFKPLSAPTRARDVVRVEDGLQHMRSDRMLERLGAGVMPAPTMVRDRQGALTETGRPLDVAIQGDGFLVARAGEGEAGLRLTRDGRLAMDGDGTLRLAGSGSAVLDDRGQPIRVDPSRRMEIRGDGVVLQDGGAVARLRVATVADPTALRPMGEGLYASRDGSPLGLRAAEGVVRQGMVEGSAVDPVRTLMGINRAGSASRSNLRVIDLINQNMQSAINRFGRVS